MAKESPKRTTKSKSYIESRMKCYKSRSDRVHVLKNKDGWAVKREGRSRAYRVHDNKSDAINTFASDYGK